MKHADHLAVKKLLETLKSEPETVRGTLSSNALKHLYEAEAGLRELVSDAESRMRETRLLDMNGALRDRIAVLEGQLAQGNK